VLQHNPAAVRELQLSSSPVLAFAATPDGRLLATGDDTGLIRFTDLRTWKASGATVKPAPAGHHAGDELLPGRADARRGHGRAASLGALLR
jgi:hypothetical protein